MAYFLRTCAWSAGFAAVFFAVYGAATLTPFGQRIDAASLGAFGWVDPKMDAILRMWRRLTPTGFAFAGLAAVVSGLIRRRFMDTLCCAAGVAATLYLSSVLKDLLGRPYFGDFAYTSNTYPSGHVAVSLMASAAIITLLPRRGAGRHTTIALTAVVAVLAVASVAVLAHRLSDVIGGIAMAGFFVPLVARGRIPSVRSFRIARGDRKLRWTLASWLISATAAISELPVITSMGLIGILLLSAISGSWLVLRLASEEPGFARSVLKQDTRLPEV